MVKFLTKPCGLTDLTYENHFDQIPFITHARDVSTTEMSLDCIYLLISAWSLQQVTDYVTMGLKYCGV